jgi:hypothetical protein
MKLRPIIINPSGIKHAACANLISQGANGFVRCHRGVRAVVRKTGTRLCLLHSADFPKSQLKFF